jgi:3-isopropylmalate/(R)-2-methylmalate dehydratase small subunit
VATIPRFVRHVGIAAPFLRPDVELEVIAPLGPGVHQHSHGTDLSAPESHLHPRDPDTSTVTVGLHAFEGLRYLRNGRENPDFILNREPYRNASILLAGENFGSGSMQEFAVMRLKACGFQAVVASSFGPVFYEDCFVYGLLPVTLGREALHTIVQAIAANPSSPMTVDLQRQVIERSGMKTMAFHMNPRLRSNLLLGVDDLDALVKHQEDAESFQNDNRKQRPWLYETGSNLP